MNGDRNAMIPIVVWSVMLVLCPYVYFRLKRGEWALALLVGMLYLSIGLMDYIVYGVVMCVPGGC